VSVIFEICGKDKVEELLDFIAKFWKKDHIFVSNRRLFDWQHKNKESYNFVLAIDEGEIIGILGFIPTSQFSYELLANNEIWLAIWKVREDVKKLGVGLGMLNYLKKQFNNPTICSLGLSQEVIPLYGVLKYELGVLEHRAFFNQDKVSFGSISPPKEFLVTSRKGSIQFDSLEESDLRKCGALFESQPKKNPEYIVKRYLEHPEYEYKLLFFKNLEAIISIVIYRIVHIDALAIARIVDVIGANILEEDFNYPIALFLKEKNIDYIDLVSNLACGNNSGFIQNSGSFILPNYFEPLEIRNVEINFAYKSNSDSLSIFRGDSDQDRPNI
tara:strand:+ start:156 stop:1142 length:987 start_codon:yes stop_codon:yes gene_type:complete